MKKIKTNRLRSLFSSESLGEFSAMAVSPTVQIGGTGNLAAAISSAPAGTENGLITRNIPYGTQPISGSVSMGAISGTVGLLAGTNTIGSVKLTDGVNTASVLTAAPGSDTGQAALAVRVVSQLGAGAGGGGAVDSSAFTLGTSTFSAGGGVFNDALAALSSGQQGEARLTASRALHAHLRDVTGNAIGSTLVGSAYAINANVVSNVAAVQDNASFAVGTSNFGPDGGVYNDSLGAMTNGAMGVNRMTAFRADHVNLRNSSGAEVGTVASPVFHANISNNGQKAIVDPQGHLLVRERSSVLFQDPMATTLLDTTNKWTQGVSGGTVTQAVGNVAVATTATALGYAWVDSLPTFTPVGTQEVLYDTGVFLPTQAANQGLFFWGYGTAAATPTTAVPVKDGIGFQFNAATGGLLQAILYASGAAVAGTTTTLTLPALGQYTRFRVVWTAQQVYWYINDLDTPAAQLSLAQYFLPSSAGFTTNAFSIVHVAVAPATTSVATTFRFANPLVGDVGRNNFQLSDANSPWRQQAVSGSGQAAIGYADSSQLVYGNISLATVTQTALIAAQGAGIRTYITSLVISNASTTAVQVTIQDGNTTLMSVYVAASGGGASVPLPASLRGSVNTALNVTLSGATTGNVLVHASGFKASY